MNRKKLNGGPDQKLYHSIREVSLLLEVKPHVLRYWETQFPGLRPRKNRAGNRIYRPEEIGLLNRIKELLYARRFTIEGARRLLQEEKRTGAEARRGGAGENGGGGATEVSPPTPAKDGSAIAVRAPSVAATPAWVSERLARVSEVREELLRLARNLRERADAMRAEAGDGNLSLAAVAAETEAVPAGAGFER